MSVDVRLSDIKDDWGAPGPSLPTASPAVTTLTILGDTSKGLYFDENVEEN